MRGGWREWLVKSIWAAKLQAQAGWRGGPVQGERSALPHCSALPFRSLGGGMRMAVPQEGRVHREDGDALHVRREGQCQRGSGGEWRGRLGPEAGRVIR